MRASVIDSPPVQLSASTTSGTGSVSTMCEEVTEMRPRSGRKPRVAALTASTADPARTRPPPVSALTPEPVTCSALTRECSWTVAPACITPIAQSEREPGRLHRGVVGREDAAPEAR